MYLKLFNFNLVLVRHKNASHSPAIFYYYLMVWLSRE